MIRRTSTIKKTYPHDPDNSLRNERLVGMALLECLKENDPEGALEILEAHLRAVNKSAFSKESGVPRSTIYRTFHNGNPTLRTLCKIVHALS